jgi:hypothetical protein
MPVRTVSALVVALGLAAGSAAAQERVLHSLSTDQVEQLLKGLSLDFKKSASRKIEGNFYYDLMLVKNRYSSRLHFFQGKEMMLDAVVPDQPLETLNRWNTTRAKLTRAAFHKDVKTSYTALEANYNFAGGVTENAVRRFIRDFEDEVAGFERFLTGKESTPIIGPEGDKIVAFSTERIEDIIAKMKLTPKKQNYSGSFLYDYESAKNYKIRLTIHKSQELTLDAVFKKMPLETLNKYNFNRKFIRAVLHNQENVEYTSLSANLDCSAGMTENMVRHFMVTFEEEVQTFIEFISKN